MFYFVLNDREADNHSESRQSISEKLTIVGQPIWQLMWQYAYPYGIVEAQSMQRKGNLQRKDVNGPEIILESMTSDKLNTVA